MSLLFDFADEVLSRPRIDFTAAAGTIIDLTYSERLKNDGSSDVHHRFFVDMAERYIARAGRQRIHTFHPRGLRYLELLVTGDLRQFELHDIALTRANYPVEKIGAFECSDPLLNEIWELGRRTQFACMEDAYLDCPWRERGLYSGDFLVQFYVNLAAFGDTRLFPRCIELFLLAQGENGLVPGGAHGLPPGRHPDYSAIIPQAIWHYWARTADTDFLRGMFPRLHKLMTGLAAFQQSPGELLDATGLDAYIDLCHMDKSGVNLRSTAFTRAASRMPPVSRIFLASGKPREWDARARQLADAIRAAFWDETQGVFLDRRRADVADTQPSVPANALPILYDIATPQQSRRAVQWLSRAMLNNFRVPEPHANTDCNVTPYFSFYALVRSTNSAWPPRHSSSSAPTGRACSTTARGPRGSISWTRTAAATHGPPPPLTTSRRRFWACSSPSPEMPITFRSARRPALFNGRPASIPTPRGQSMFAGRFARADRQLTAPLRLACGWTCRRPESPSAT